MSDFINTLLNSKKLQIQGPSLSDSFFNGWFADTPSQSVSDKLVKKGMTVKFNDQILNAVVWQEGSISEYQLSLNTDVVSFSFSGCVMAFYQGNDQGKYAAHIHTGGYDCKLAWRDYLAGKSSLEKLVMFRPDCDRREALINDLNRQRVYYEDATLMGVITTNLECYSVGLVLKDSNNRNLWDVAFVEQHEVSSEPAAYDKILSSNLLVDTTNVKLTWDTFWKTQTIREMRQQCLPWRPWEMNLFGIGEG